MLEKTDEGIRVAAVLEFVNKCLLVFRMIDPDKGKVFLAFWSEFCHNLVSLTIDAAAGNISLDGNHFNHFQWYRSRIVELRKGKIETRRYPSIHKKDVQPGIEALRFCFGHGGDDPILTLEKYFEDLHKYLSTHLEDVEKL